MEEKEPGYFALEEFVSQFLPQMEYILASHQISKMKSQIKNIIYFIIIIVGLIALGIGDLIKLF